LNAEIAHHLEAGAADGRANSRNGYGRKSVLTETGKIALGVPRDRLSTFDPQLIGKYQRRFPGLDEKIISMYACGMSTRERPEAPLPGVEPGAKGVEDAATGMWHGQGTARHPLRRPLYLGVRKTRHWLGQAQPAIEKALARRHLEDGCLVLQASPRGSSRRPSRL